jgi:glycosyltransferase involved in cell wall biosynthesis
MIVSVILPCTNLDCFLIESINSILNQTYTNFELLVISSNNSNEFKINFLNLFYDKRITVLYPNLKGLTNALNYGIEKSIGDIIIRMDSDDISESNRISCIVDVFTRNSKTIVVFSDYQFIDSNGKLISKNRKIYYQLFSTRSLLPFRCIIAHPTVALTRKAYISYSGYMFGAYCEDYDLWLRIRRDKNSIFTYIDSPLLKYRIHDNQLTSRVNLYNIYSYNIALKLRELLFTRELIYIPALAFTIFDFLFIKFSNFIKLIFKK